MQEEKKLVIVVSSKSSAEEKKDFIQHLIDTCGFDDESEDVVDIVFNVNPNGESLTKIYNEAMNQINLNEKLNDMIHQCFR